MTIPANAVPGQVIMVPGEEVQPAGASAGKEVAPTDPQQAAGQGVPPPETDVGSVAGGKMVTRYGVTVFMPTNEEQRDNSGATGDQKAGP